MMAREDFVFVWLAFWFLGFQFCLKENWESQKKGVHAEEVEIITTDYSFLCKKDSRIIFENNSPFPFQIRQHNFRHEVSLSVAYFRMTCHLTLLYWLVWEEVMIRTVLATILLVCLLTGIQRSLACLMGR